MRLTIIPIDGAVYENGLCYQPLTWDGTPSNVHALQYFDNNTGWIEFDDGTPNENITVLPQWADNAMAAWQVAYDEEHNPPASQPVPYEIKYQMMIIERDKRLVATDYTQLPDVIALHDSAWLQGWVTYRQELRDLPALVNPSNIDNIPWPVPPLE
jgi:hypothetical protein